MMHNSYVYSRTKSLPPSLLSSSSTLLVVIEHRFKFAGSRGGAAVPGKCLSATVEKIRLLYSNPGPTLQMSSFTTGRIDNGKFAVSGAAPTGNPRSTFLFPFYKVRGILVFFKLLVCISSR
jgi:hypothetical protein